MFTLVPCSPSGPVSMIRSVCGSRPKCQAATISPRSSRSARLPSFPLNDRASTSGPAVARLGRTSARAETRHIALGGLNPPGAAASVTSPLEFTFTVIWTHSDFRSGRAPRSRKRLFPSDAWRTSALSGSKPSEKRDPFDRIVCGRSPIAVGYTHKAMVKAVSARIDSASGKCASEPSGIDCFIPSYSPSKADGNGCILMPGPAGSGSPWINRTSRAVKRGASELTMKLTRSPGRAVSGSL
jgi:hypothetical protein